MRKLVEKIIADIENLETRLIDVVQSKETGKPIVPDLREKLSGYDIATQNTVSSLNRIVIDLSRESSNTSLIIRKGFHIALILITLTFLIGSSLSIIFGVLISLNLVRPINEIVSNFRAFIARKDFAREIKVASKDEISTLANEYNRFIGSIESMTSFKKIIEEDETVDDVYNRLGDILTHDFGLSNCVIYEISTHKNILKTAYPCDIASSDLHCNVEILSNCDLCRVKRTGHIISSKENSDICKFSKTDTDKVYVCMPIFISGKVGGVVQFISDKDESSSPEFKEMVGKAEQYIIEAQPVLEAKRIMRAFKESSIRDGLTGVYNRRFLDETASV